jgi:asparagine synthase (glutamine-hydrolysing)
MRSDVRIGTSLSGGVDSTAVVCAVAYIEKKLPDETRLCKDWQNAFSAGFPNTEFDESVYAQKVADYLGIPLKIFEIQAPPLESVIDEQWFFEELYPTPSTPMMAVYKQMRENGVVVSMDGHGADELLGGYHNVLLAAWTDANFNLKKIKEIHNVYRDNFFFNHDKKFRFQDYLAHIWKRKKVLVGKYLSRTWAEKFFGLEKERRMGEFNFGLYRLFTATVLPTLLRNYDRYSMAHGVEVRMPFMDWRLVSFALALPWTAKIRNGLTKAVLRDAVAPFSPHEVIYRKSKIGYTAPVHAWMNGPWREPLIDLMHSSEFLSCPLMPDASAVVRRFLPALAGSKLSMFESFQLWEQMLPYFWYKSILAGDKVKLHAA